MACLAIAVPVRAADIWYAPHAPFKLYGNAYYVGTAGISAVLVTSPQGHVLIDGTLKDAVPQIAANIRTLGFKIEDVKLILNSHVHFDHAEGIAELQRLSGAAVKASAKSAPVLASGKAGADDPQAATLPVMGPAANVTAFKDGEILRVGPITMKPVPTPGHTPGGTTWTWEICEGTRCLHMVYADSLNPISAPNYRFTDDAAHPGALAAFKQSIAAMAALPCDIIVSVHPEISDLWTRLQKREAGAKDGLTDTNGCRAYAEMARAALDKRIASEK